MPKDERVMVIKIIGALILIFIVLVAMNIFDNGLKEMKEEEKRLIMVMQKSKKKKYYIEENGNREYIENLIFDDLFKKYHIILKEKE